MDKSRADFEAWAAPRGYRIERRDEGYLDPYADDVWKAWQASRKQALEQIAPYLQRIKDHAEFDDPHLNTKVGQLLSILDEVAAIRSLEGNAPKETT